MDSLVKPICKFLNFLYHIFLVFACLVLLSIVIIVSAQVFVRQVMGGTVRLSQEVALMLMVWMAFITCAVGVERNLHIGIEMFYQMFPKKLQKILFYINWVLVGIVGYFFMYYGVKLTLSTTTSKLPATGWPKCTMYWIIPVCGFFIIYFALIKITKRDDLLPAPVFFEKKPEGGNN